jgi:hypothetical protein
MKLFLANASIHYYKTMATDEQLDQTFLTWQSKLTNKPRILISYHYTKDVLTPLNKWFRKSVKEIMCDSGAYSAFTLGVPISVHEYGQFLVANQKYFKTIASLDVVGDPKQGYINTLILRDQYHLNVMPCWHVGEDFDWLQKYHDAGFKRVAFGGMVPHSRKVDMLGAWISWAFNEVAKRNLVFDVHGFGMTNLRYMKMFPWYSVDSSSWTMAFRAGILPLFDFNNGVMHQIDFNSKLSVLENMDVIELYQTTPQHIFSLRTDSEKLYELSKIAMLSWINVELWINRRRKNETGNV